MHKIFSKSSFWQLYKILNTDGYLDIKEIEWHYCCMVQGAQIMREDTGGKTNGRYLVTNLLYLK